MNNPAITRLTYFTKDLIRTVDKYLSILFFYFDKQAIVKYCRRHRIATIGTNCWLAPSVKFDLFVPPEAKKLHRPLITLGNNCVLTEYVTLITHDTSYRFFGGLYGQTKPRKWGAITLGDNVFIGNGSLILPGVTIGSNSLVGAGSVVTKSIPPETVVAGNPAKKIMSIQQYVQKKS